MFYANYVYLCNKLNKSPSAVAEEMGFKRSVVTAWKKGRQPRESTLMKVAEYFGITVDELLQSRPNVMSYGKTPLLDTKKAATDNNGDGHSASTKLMISIFESLSEEDQWSILLQAQEKARNQKAQDAHTETE